MVTQVYTISGKIVTHKSNGGIKNREMFFENKPKDRCYLVYITFFLIGNLQLLPSSFFTTANDYWMYKFRNVTNEDTLGGPILIRKNSTLLPKSLDVSFRTWWQIEFFSFITIISQTTSLIFLLFCTFFGSKIKPKPSIIWSIILMLILFIIMAVFIVIDTDTWQHQFFVITLTIVGAINAVKSVYNVSIYVIISKFPNGYLIPYLMGQGTAGIFSAILQIISLALGASSLMSALIYFWCGIFFLGLTLFLTICSLNSSLYKFYMTGFKQERKCAKIMTFNESLKITKSIWSSVVTMGLVLLTLVPVYPAITALVVSQSYGLNAWGNVYFTPVGSYLLYCVSEVIGRGIASKFKKCLNGPTLITISVIRMIFYIPAIMLCNAKPRYNFPVIFNQDWQYMVIIGTFGLTCGYLANMAYTDVNRLAVKNKTVQAYSVLSTINGIILAVSSFLSHICVESL